jgi:hypothetical protein
MVVSSEVQPQEIIIMFLDSFNYPYPCSVVELAIALKGKKPFDEFTQALMALISNVQMVNSKFVINPLNPYSKEKNISSKGGISPDMTKLGTHIKMSGNGNVFNEKRFGEIKGMTTRAASLRKMNSTTLQSGSLWSCPLKFNRKRSSHFWIPSITHTLVLLLSWPSHSRAKNPLMNLLRP